MKCVFLYFYYDHKIDSLSDQYVYCNKTNIYQYTIATCILYNSQNVHKKLHKNIIVYVYINMCMTVYMSCYKELVICIRNCHNFTDLLSNLISNSPLLVQNQNQNQNNFISKIYNVSNIKINSLLMGANSWKPI